MTAFPSPIQPTVDDLVKANRAKTPKAATEARKTPRFSIEELNNMDSDQVKDHYLGHSYDDRSPIVKVLDLVDLPRNVVANVLFRPAGQDTSKLRTGAFGLPSITTSDALGSLGMKPGLVRGLAGFVGDVALDPLTYIGPAGWGARVASTAGREVAIGARGARDLKRAIEGVRKTGVASAKNAETRALIDQLTASSGRTFRDGAEHADYLSSKIYGAVKTPETRAGRTLGAFDRILGGDKKYEGGLLADALEPQRWADDGAQQARDFVAQFGKANAPGVSLGGKGSQVAHIPFTELSVSTGPISRGGRAALSDYNKAASAAARPLADILNDMPGHAAIAGDANAIESAVDDVDSHFKETEYVASTLPFDQVDGYKADRSREMQTMLESNRAKLNDLTKRIEETGVDPLKPQSIADIMAMQRVKEQTTAKFSAMESRMRAYPDYKRAINIENIADNEADAVSDSVNNAMSAWSLYNRSVDGAVGNFMQLHPDEKALVDAASSFLGTDERMIGRAALSGPASLLKYPGNPAMMADLTGGISRRVENAFGVRGSKLADTIRQVQHSSSPGRIRAVQTLESGILREVKDAFSANGMTPNSDDVNEILSLLTGYAHQTANERAGRDIFYTTDFATGQPAKWLQDIENAVRSGKLGAAGGDLPARLKAIAGKYGNDLLDEMWRVEDSVGIAPQARTGYFPNVPTGATQQAISRGKKYGDKPATGKIAESASEAFQKERSFDQVRFTAPDGTQKRLFRVDEDLARRLITDPTDIEALKSEGRTDIADELEQLINDYREYEGSNEFGDWHSTAPSEMNDLFQQKRFSILTDGADLPGGYMHTNFLSAIASRVGSHHEAMARETFAQMRQQWAKPIDGTKFKQAEKGGNFVAADGTVGKVVKVSDIKGREDKGFQVGGQVYRRIASDLRADPKNPMISMLGRESTDAIYPKEIADAVERIAEKFQTPESVESLLKGYDTIIRAWKNVTLFHPAWSIFNVVGDTLNGVSDGLPLKHFFDPANAKFSAKVAKNLDNPEKLRGMSVVANGQTMTGEDLANIAISKGVIDGTMMEEAAWQLASNGHMVLSSQLASKGKLERLRPSQLKSDYKELLGSYALGRRAERGDKLKAAGTVISDRIASNVFAPWFRVNQKASNYIRINMLLAYLQDGNSVESAARRVVSTQFDYSNATQIEREVFKRMLPFYSWMRNNGAYQIKKLFESPVYAASYPKVQAAIEEAIAGEDRVPLQQRPNWMRQALALQVGRDPDHRFSVLFGGALPAADVFQYLTPVLGPEGVQDFLRYFVSSANPIAGAAFDLGTGRERFSGRTIGKDGDLSTGEYLLNQVRPIAEIGKIGKALDQGVTQGVGRAVLGGRVQDFSQDRLESGKLREFKDVETNLRRRISKAEREGNKQESLRARGRLMSVYIKMEEAGLESEVPKWARRQLAEQQ